jgi:hypothetical protein
MGKKIFSGDNGCCELVSWPFFFFTEQPEEEGKGSTERRGANARSADCGWRRQRRRARRRMPDAGYSTLDLKMVCVDENPLQ